MIPPFAVMMIPSWQALPLPDTINIYGPKFRARQLGKVLSRQAVWARFAGPENLVFPDINEQKKFLCGAGRIFSGHRRVADPAVQKISQTVTGSGRS